MVRETSLEAYERIQGKIADRQRECLLALERLGEANNREIADFLRRPINVVVPRIFELREMGLVVESRTIVDQETKRKTICWRIK